jgi:hypothetical protein
MYRYLLFDWDGLGGIRPILDDPFECGTGIESDGNPIVSTGDWRLWKFITGGLVKDAESVVVSSIFLVFSFFF